MKSVKANEGIKVTEKELFEMHLSKRYISCSSRYLIREITVRSDYLKNHPLTKKHYLQILKSAQDLRDELNELEQTLKTQDVDFFEKIEDEMFKQARNKQEID